MLSAELLPSVSLTPLVLSGKGCGCSISVVLAVFVSVALSSTLVSLVLLLTGAGVIPSSGTLDKETDRELPRILDVSAILFFEESKRLRSGAAVERTVPPSIFSRATEVEAVAFFGVLGHGPYQLFALRTCDDMALVLGGLQMALHLFYFYFIPCFASDMTRTCFWPMESGIAAPC